MANDWSRGHYHFSSESLAWVLLLRHRNFCKVETCEGRPRGGIFLSLDGKKWRTTIRSSPTRWPSAASSPISLLCVTPSKNCEGLSGVAFLHGNGCVMRWEVLSCERKNDTAAAGGEKKWAMNVRKFVILWAFVLNRKV